MVTSNRRRHPAREATRGILLLVGLAVGTIVVATVIAAITVALLG
jgi:uncharacterized protein (DUF697 family)